MRTKLLILFVIVLVIQLVACSTEVEYTETTINESYRWQTETPVVFDAAYPVFDDEVYQELNSAIESEVKEWNELYQLICTKALDECEWDPDFAKLQRYVKAEYSVSSTSKEISVTFDAQYFQGGNVEPSYKVIYKLDLETNMVFKTYIETNRVYG